MKGDFSRRTFDAKRHYSSVRMQQGRVQLDADSNEQAEIVAYRIETEALDLIGAAGGPYHAAGFRLITDATGLTADEQAFPGNVPSPAIPAGTFAITAGRYYVDGILCENDRMVVFGGQPDYPDATLAADGAYLAYLDVWQRHVTALEDPKLREVALGGPDTATRVKTVWQVKLHALGALSAPNCKTAFDAFLAQLPAAGTLNARATNEAQSTDPCIVAPSAGYRGLENQLYRVEIHDGGQARDMNTAGGAVNVTLGNTPNVVTVAPNPAWQKGIAVEIFTASKSIVLPVAKVTPGIGPTTLELAGEVSGMAAGDGPKIRVIDSIYKWSRDNASVVTTITKIEGAQITVHDTGRDTVLGFAEGQWVEITDERKELLGEKGEIFQIAKVDGKRIVTLEAAPTPLHGGATGVDPKYAAKLRRWDGLGAVQFKNNSTWLDLESGIQIQLKSGNYRAGDYWLIPARAATSDARSGQIEWPGRPGTGDPLEQPPVGVAHHYAALGVVTKAGNALALEDCRKLFPPVTELTSFFYLGGDGQEVMPDLTQPATKTTLPAQLVVGVANGQWPVKGARVRFKIVRGQGAIQVVGPDAPLPGATPQELIVETRADGTARCTFALDNPADPAFDNVYQVEAALLDVTNTVRHLPVRFTANRSIASQVAFDPKACAALQGKKDVQSAIEQIAHAATLRAVGGDGQDAMPGFPLGRPLEVEVRDACGPIAGAKLAVSATGRVAESLAALPAAGPTLPLSTNAAGHASFFWLPNPAGPPAQAATVTLETPARVPGPNATVSFTANLSTASQVAFTPHQDCLLLAGTTTVQEALDKICKDGSCREIVVTPESDVQAIFDKIPELADAHLCFAPGQYEIKAPIVVGGKGHLKISGAGAATFLQAAAIEKAFVFIECRSVLVRDLRARAGVAEVPPKPGDESPPRHLNGVLTFRGCDRVTVEGVTLQSGAGPVRAAAALTIVDADSARVRGCTLGAGDGQVGLLLVDVKRAQVEDNTVDVSSKPVAMPDRMRNPRYRFGLRKLVLSNVRVNELETQPLFELSEYHAERLARLAGGNDELVAALRPLVTPAGLGWEGATLFTVQALVQGWSSLLASASPSGSPSQVKAAIEDIAESVIGEYGGIAGFKSPVPLGELGGFTTLFQRLAQERPAVAAQGIVVAGETAGDVRITHNTIRGALQGIHIGLSHSPKEDAENPRRDRADRVLVTGNTVHVRFPLDEQRDRHGIFLGNARSAILQDNFVTVERTPLAAVGYIEGIRVYGELGALLVVRQNHFVDFDCGVHVHAINRPNPRLWRVADNIAEGAQDQEILEPDPLM